MSLRRLRRDWESLAALDPLWAILSDPTRRFGKWDLNEFLLTGETQIAAVMRHAGELGYPRNRGLALDFGCGVGRATRALGTYFPTCYGIDISETMITQAREINHTSAACEFMVNTSDNLRVFPADHFDMIYTCGVLQHMPNKGVIKSYVSEFLRTLKEGGLLVCQVLCALPLRNQLQIRRRLFGLLSRVGVKDRFLYETLGLHPIRIVPIPERELIGFLGSIGANILDVQSDPAASAAYKSRTFYVTKDRSAPRLGDPHRG
jgi:SAM-dependent methyltransferase